MAETRPRKSGRKRLSPEEEQMQKRREASIRSLYMNRFLLIRYSLATFFFSNFLLAYLAWPGLTGIAAAFLFAASLYPCWQMGTIYGKKKVNATWTRRFFQLQWVFLTGALVLLFTMPVDQLFPFLNNSLQARSTAAAALGIGWILATLSLRRFGQIEAGTDKTWQRIQFFEKKYGIQI